MADTCAEQKKKLDNQKFEIRLMPFDLPKAFTFDEQCVIKQGIPIGDKEEITCVQVFPFPNGEAGIIDCNDLKNPPLKVTGEPKCSNKQGVLCGCNGAPGVWPCRQNPIDQIYKAPAFCESLDCGQKMTLGGGGYTLAQLNEYVALEANNFCNVRAKIGLMCTGSGDYTIGFPTAQISITASGTHSVRCACSSLQAIAPFTVNVVGYVPIAREMTVPGICTSNGGGGWMRTSADPCEKGETEKGPFTPTSKTKSCPSSEKYFCCPKKNIACSPTIGVFKKGESKTTDLMCNNLRISCNNTWGYTNYTEPFPVPTSIDDLCAMEDGGCKKGGYLAKCNTPFVSTFKASDLIKIFSDLGNFADYAMSSLFAFAAFEAAKKAEEKVNNCDEDDGTPGYYLVNELSFNSASGSFGWADKPADMGNANARITLTVDGESRTWDAGVGPGALQ